MGTLKTDEQSSNLAFAFDAASGYNCTVVPPVIYLIIEQPTLYLNRIKMQESLHDIYVLNLTKNSQQTTPFIMTHPDNLIDAG